MWAISPSVSSLRPESLRGSSPATYSSSASTKIQNGRSLSSSDALPRSTRYARARRARLQLGHQARLADARLALDQQRRRFPALEGVERAVDGVQLGVAPDEALVDPGCHVASGSSITPRPGAQGQRSGSAADVARRAGREARSVPRTVNPHPATTPVSAALESARRARAEPVRRHRRQHDPQRRAADDPQRARREREPAAVDRRRLPARVRGPAADRRQPRRPLRPPPRAGHRPARLRRRFAGRDALRQLRTR